MGYTSSFPSPEREISESAAKSSLMRETAFGGADLSYTGCGLVVIDGADVYKTVIKTGAKQFDHPAERLIYIRDKVVDWFMAFAPTLICIEGYSFGSKAGREKAGELGGAVRIGLYDVPLDYRVVAPTTLKAFVTGKGNAQKSLMLREVYKRWKFETDSDDINDAFALAKFAETLSSPKESWSKKFQQFAEKANYGA